MCLLIRFIYDEAYLELKRKLIISSLQTIKNIKFVEFKEDIFYNP